MKLNKCEKTGSYTYEMEISFEADSVKEAVSKVYRREGKRYTVPGFRKGHAPRNLIEKMYGADVFYLDAVNELFPDAYEAALKEKGIEPVAQPDAEILSVSPEDGAVVKVIVTVKPEVKLGAYKGLKVEKTVEKLDEARVDEEITRLRERNARLLTRNGAAQDGDIALIDYEGSVDGVPFDGGKDEGYKLTLGSGQFIPGFEEQVAGHSAGETFDVNVAFPEEYHAENLAGKDAVFKVTLHEAQYKELPELDDEFAKDVSEQDTLADMKKDIREKMQEDLNKQADGEAENKLLELVVEGMEVEVPPAMADARIDEMAHDFSHRLEQQGLDLKTYLQYTGMDELGFREGFREQAEKQVKSRLALEAIVKAEGITASDEDLEAEFARVAETYKMELEEVKKLLPAEGLREDLALNKAVDFLKTSAKITEKTKESDDEKEK